MIKRWLEDFSKRLLVSQLVFQRLLCSLYAFVVLRFLILASSREAVCERRLLKVSDGLIGDQ